MAGGKETPRQKMIGMMYLVLTALLALNVSNAVLEKFAIIDSTLTDLIGENNNKNESKLKSINDSKSDDNKVKVAKEKAAQVRELTKKTLVALDDYKNKMKTEPDGKKIEGEELVLNTVRAEELMLDSKKPEYGQGYEKTLNSFVIELNKIMGLKVPFQKLTKNATDYEAFKNSVHHQGKSFLEFSFEGTPTMGAIATISQMQTEVLEYEGVALDTLFNQAEGVQVKFDKTVPMVRPERSILVAGQEYKADLFIAAAASGENPEMFFNNAPVPIETDAGTGIKMGKIKFRANASTFGKDGLAEMSYKVKINLKGKPFEDVIKYKVAKPVAKFESESANLLYQKCGFEASVTVQGLEEASGISLKAPADQGTVTPLGPGKFVIFPTKGQIDVTVYVNGSPIETKQFKTKPVPTPQAQLIAGSAPYDAKVGVPTGTKIVKLVPGGLPDDFKRLYPKDANYRIVSMSVIVSGKGKKDLNSGTIDLDQVGARPGDNVAIFNVKVARTTWDPNDRDDEPVLSNMETSFYLKR
ncbi:MAG: hypothetical protein JSU09_16220 [Bacteroidetes bacterium]|nr:hypothetical protein [Bacteroidota bacterium]